MMKVNQSRLLKTATKIAKSKTGCKMMKDKADFPIQQQHQKQVETKNNKNKRRFSFYEINNKQTKRERERDERG